VAIAKDESLFRQVLLDLLAELIPLIVAAIGFVLIRSIRFEQGLNGHN
jgi:hypothetical protein